MIMESWLAGLEAETAWDSEVAHFCGMGAT